jgi:hypothetical protein
MSKSTPVIFGVENRAMHPSERLVAFLYDLMRDNLPVGTVEQLVRNNEPIGLGEMVTYSNKYLATYARELAIRLTSVIVQTPHEEAATLPITRILYGLASHRLVPLQNLGPIVDQVVKCPKTPTSIGGVRVPAPSPAARLLCVLAANNIPFDKLPPGTSIADPPDLDVGLWQGCRVWARRIVEET